MKPLMLPSIVSTPSTVESLGLLSKRRLRFCGRVLDDYRHSKGANFHGQRSPRQSALGFSSNTPRSFNGVFLRSGNTQLCVQVLLPTRRQLNQALSVILYSAAILRPIWPGSSLRWAYCDR